MAIVGKIYLPYNPRMKHDDLKAWRKRHGLTQAMAAQVLGLGLTGYQRQEYGERAVSTQTTLLALLYDILGSERWPSCGM